MKKVSLKIPQIGEGLQEARIVAFLKQPGDAVERDEPIYQMETDKAVMDVESPYKGKLVAWNGEADQVMPIGGEIAEMEVADDETAEESKPETASEPQKATKEPSKEKAGSTGAKDAWRRPDLPPKTRAYAKEKGLTDEQVAALPKTGKRLTPDDVDAFLKGGQKQPAHAGEDADKYQESKVASRQRVLNSRMMRGNATIVPGTMSLSFDWGPIEHLRTRIKHEGGSFQPSAFTMFAFCVAKAMKNFPAFRSQLVDEETIRTYEHVNLGIAVSRPKDELLVACVDQADELEWKEFAQAMWDSIKSARAGNDQAKDSITLSITNMQSYGIRDASAVVVPPSMCTLFLGEPRWDWAPGRRDPHLMRAATLGVTFDHRLANGVGAARFMAAVREYAEAIEEHVTI
jgi:pyruvate dehydrogenase E2 component (dihydrolipoamide acetyltransferase)